LQATNAQLEADIKVREQVEETLRESRAKLAAALASMTDSVLITDAEGGLSISTTLMPRSIDLGTKTSAPGTLPNSQVWSRYALPMENRRHRRCMRCGARCVARQLSASNTSFAAETVAKLGGKHLLQPDSRQRRRHHRIGHHRPRHHRGQAAEKVIETTLQRFYIILSNLLSGILLVTNEGGSSLPSGILRLFRLRESPADLVATFDSEKVIAKIDTVTKIPCKPLFASVRLSNRTTGFERRTPIQNGCMFIRDLSP